MARLTKEEKSEQNLKEYTIRYTGNNTCIRFDYYLDNDDCSPCDHYKYCLCKSRKLTKADKKSAAEAAAPPISAASMEKNSAPQG